MFRIQLLSPAVTLAALIAVVATVAAQPSAWFNAGSELVGDDGVWDFSDRIVPVNLVDEGLTYLRVSSGPCTGSGDAYVVYQANLQSPPAGETAWFGTLVASGIQASTLPDRADANAYLLPGAGDTSTVRIALSGQQPNTTLTACFGKPS